MDPTPHQDDEIERAPGDLMVGADPIRVYLIELGILPKNATVTDVYYLRRRGLWPIGNTGGGEGGGKLIASKRRLSNHAAKLARGAA